MNGVSFGAVLRISASSAATSLLRGSSSCARYSAGVDALSWPFIFSTAYHGRHRSGRTRPAAPWPLANARFCTTVGGNSKNIVDLMLRSPVLVIALSFGVEAPRSARLWARFRSEEHTSEL